MQSLGGTIARDTCMSSGVCMQGIGDPDFFTSILGNLPGVDVNDPAIQAALQSSQQRPDQPSDKPKPEDKK